MNTEEAALRFARDVAALTPEAQGAVGVAVSGGPDSLALLLLASAAWPDRVRAATVDHGLRPESAAEALFVAAVCRERAIAHDILPVRVEVAGRGLQAAAREARYAALAAWMRSGAIPTLLTAHHADDQAETLLMRLNRGSGAAGLAGIRAQAPFPAAGEGALLVRPLLAWRRSELEEVVEAAGIEAVHDTSNEDESYDRVRIRRHLAEAPWLDAAALARSAAALAEADEALATTASELGETRLRKDGPSLLLRPSGIPAELLRRLLVTTFHRLGASPRGEQVRALVDDLQSGRTVTLAGIKCSPGALWRFEPAPPRRPGGG